MPTFDARSVRKRHTRLCASKWGPSARFFTLALDLTHCLSSLRRTAVGHHPVHCEMLSGAYRGSEHRGQMLRARSGRLGASVRPIPCGNPFALAPAVGRIGPITLYWCVCRKAQMFDGALPRQHEAA